MNGINLWICFLKVGLHSMSCSCRHPVSLVRHMLGHFRQLTGAEKSGWFVSYRRLACVHFWACGSGKWLWHVSVLSKTQASTNYEKASVSVRKLQMFVFKNFKSLFPFLFEREGDMERNLLCTDLLSKVHNSQGWAELKPGAKSSVQVPCVGSRDPSTWAITCRLPRCTGAGSWVEG